MSSQLLFCIVFSVILHLGLGTVNFALRKPAVQSTTLEYYNFNWTADKAVDGNSSGSNPDNSRTCSATSVTGDNANHTWEVDIGFQIIVKTITVYGRTDSNFDQLRGFKLFIGNATRPWIYNQELPSFSSGSETYVFKPNDAIASVISLVRLGQIMFICEVTVEGECLGGNFSEFCNLTCGTCYAYQPCNKETGTCPLGCDQGWTGSFCKEGCERGNYGYNCNETCGNCLYGNSSCSPTDGNCINGCIAGWQGYRCNIECVAGTYSYNCNETCGNCLYGINNCSTSNGHCTNGCKAGWEGDDCKKGCENGNFGYNCNETCGNCLYGNSNCSIIDGNCTNGCIDGWQRDHCNRDTIGMVNPDDVGPNIGIIVGSVLVAVGVSIFAMVILIVFVKNRRKKDNNEMITDNVTTAALYANLVVGNPDAACNIIARSREERESSFSAIAEASLQRGMPNGATNSYSGVMEPDVSVHNEYEKLRYVTESTESGYSTIDHNLINPSLL